MKNIKTLFVFLLVVAIFATTNVSASFKVNSFDSEVIFNEMRRPSTEEGVVYKTLDGKYCTETTLNYQLCEWYNNGQLQGFISNQNIFNQVGTDTDNQPILSQTQNWFIALNKVDAMGTKRYCGRNGSDCGNNDIAFGFNFAYDDLALFGNNGTYCKLTTKYDDLKYDIGSIIDYYNSKLTAGTSTVADYYYINLFINKYVAEKTAGKSNQYINVFKGNIVAESSYREIVNQNTSSVFSNNISKFDKSGKIYSSNSINITGVPINNKFDITMLDASGKDYSKYAFFTFDGSSYKVKICTDKTDDLCSSIETKLPAGDYSISVKTSVTQEKSAAAFYECTLNFPTFAQGNYTYISTGYSSSGAVTNTPIALSYGKPATKVAYSIPAYTKNDTITKTYELKSQFSYTDNGTIDVPIVDDNKNTNIDNNDHNNKNDNKDDNTQKIGTINLKVINKDYKILSDTKLKVCSDKDCKTVISEGKVIADSLYKVSNIAYGKYYVSITDVPDGYVKPKDLITLTLNSGVLDEVIKIDTKTSVPNTASNYSIIIIVCGIIGIIVGGYLMYINIKKNMRETH